MADQIAIATVVAIQGRAFARSENGEIRQLEIGDIVYRGDTILTGERDFVELATADGLRLAIDENQEVYMSEELLSEALIVLMKVHFLLPPLIALSKP